MTYACFFSYELFKINKIQNNNRKKVELILSVLNGEFGGQLKRKQFLNNGSIWGEFYFDSVQSRVNYHKLENLGFYNYNGFYCKDNFEIEPRFSSGEIGFKYYYPSPKCKEYNKQISIK